MCLWLGAGACADGGDQGTLGGARESPAGQRRRPDRGGVRSPPGRSSERWTVDRRPELSIELPAQDTLEPSGVTGARSLSDGRLLVGHRSPARVDRYSASGALDGTFRVAAGELVGAGPLLGMAPMEGDSTVLYLGGESPRLAVLDGEGAMIREVVLTSSGPSGTDLARYAPLGVLSSGTFVLGPSSIAPGADLPPGIGVVEALILEVDLDGAVRRASADPASLSVFRAERGIPLPLGPRSIAVLAEDRVYLSHGRVREVRVFGASGLEQLIRRLESGRPHDDRRLDGRARADDQTRAE